MRFLFYDSKREGFKSLNKLEMLSPGAFIGKGYFAVLKHLTSKKNNFVTLSLK